MAGGGDAARWRPHLCHSDALRYALLSSEALTPGPRGLELLRTLLAYTRDPFQTLLDLEAEYGDVVRFIDGPVRAFAVSGVDNVEAVLVRDAWSFVPVRPYTVERAMRRGLFTSHGELHHHQRDLLKAAYAHAQVAGFGEIISRSAARIRDAWQPGLEMDLEGELERLVVTISAEILFGDAIQDDWDGLVAAAVPVNEYLGTRSTNPLTGIPEALRLRSDDRKFWRSMQRLEHAIEREIHRRRTRARSRPDFLATLLDSGMSDLQVREEAIANHTTGNAVTVSGLLFTLYMLAQHPDVETRLLTEIDALGGRLPSFEDLPRLEYLRMVVTEAMRLYPPAWTIGRRVAQDYVLDDVYLPAGSLVLVSPYVVHRDRRCYLEPERFDPERWRTVRPSGLAYFPFSAGPRSCLGEHLAWMEMQLSVATIAQRWRLRLMPGYPLELMPLISLRPKYGMRMRAEPR